MDATELAELRRDALQAVRDVLVAPDAKPADRLRAAEVVARLEATATARGGVHELDDKALLAIARGEVGGTPRKGDPETPSAGAVPSDTDDDPDSRLAMSDERRTMSAALEAMSAERRTMSDEKEATRVPRETSPKGTQNGPALRGAPLPPDSEPNPFLTRKKDPKGTQNGPAISGGPAAQIALEAKMGQDSAREPEPWE